MSVRVMTLAATAGLMMLAGTVLAQGNRQPPAVPPGAAKAQADFPLAASQSKSPGETVFRARCQYCHLDMGMGTLTLAKRLGPERSLIAERKDLTADYIRAVVRNGFSTMPAINRAEVSDAELDLLAGYLTRNNPGERKGRK